MGDLMGPLWVTTKDVKTAVGWIFKEPIFRNVCYLFKGISIRDVWGLAPFQSVKCGGQIQSVEAENDILELLIFP